METTDYYFIHILQIEFGRKDRLPSKLSNVSYQCAYLRAQVESISVQRLKVKKFYEECK